MSNTRPPYLDLVVLGPKVRKAYNAPTKVQYFYRSIDPAKVGFLAERSDVRLATTLADPLDGGRRAEFRAHSCAGRPNRARSRVHSQLG